MTESPSKPVFSLSKSNIIYYVVFAASYLIVFIALFETSDRPEKTSYQIGYFVGQLLTSILLTTFVAWIVWRISGKKKTAASVTFNIVLTLLVLSQIGQAGRRQREGRVFDDLQKQKDVFKQEISQSDDPAAVDAAFDKYSSSIKDGFDKMSETSSGREKQFYRIMSEYLGEVQAMVKDWNATYDVVLTPRILDFSLLTNDEEFNYQKQVLTTYVEKTRNYRTSYHALVPKLKQQLSVLGNDENAAEAVRGAEEKYAAQKVIFEQLMQAHIKYGETMIQLLELLQNNREAWGHENDELAIYTDEVVEAYNKLLDSLASHEATINTLSAQLIEGI